MNLHDRFMLDPNVLAGKPVVRGTRLAIDFAVGLLAQDWSEAGLLRNYRGLTHTDITAGLQSASDPLQAETGARAAPAVASQSPRKYTPPATSSDCSCASESRYGSETV